MIFYKYTEDIVHQDMYGDPEPQDRINIYGFNDINIIIYYSERYNDWTTTNHYDISINSKMKNIEPTNFEMQGFIYAIFK